MTNPTTAEQLQQAIAALEAQRAALGDAVVATAIAALRQQLAALTPPAAAEERRRATVLFADLCNFTALAEQVDAEQVQALLAELWARLDRIILAHGGTIDKHLGDAVLAAWGLEQAREDQPEQAVRAALALQQEMANLRAQEQEALGNLAAQLRLRVGINTGLVSTATVASTGERNLIGDAVNLAARLQEAAPPDGILISQATCEAVRGLFELSAQPPLAVKGRREPVTTYLLHGVRPRAFYMPTRGLAGVVTRTVGREGELAALQAAYQRAVEGQGLQWLTVTGEAGVGKSRLVTELIRWLEQRPERIRFFKARAWPHTQYSPYFLLRDLLALRFEIHDGAPLAEAQARLIAGFSETFGVETGAEAAAFIGQLIGLDFRHSPWIAHIADKAQQIYGRAAVLFHEYWLRLGSSVDRPVVLLLEDLHWADQDSLALLSTTLAALQAQRECPPLALCVVATARPELWEQETPWAQNAPAHERLLLEPLPVDAARDLVRELLQWLPAVPEWLSALLVENGAGNPYFTEELVQWLIEHGVIRTGPEIWEVAEERAVGLSVPGTVQGVLQARLESLSPSERAALQRAAVVGRAFWRGAVEYIGQEAVPEADWADLQRRELAFRQPVSQLEGEEEYQFKHALLRDVVYEYTLKRQRRAFHQRAAEWLVRTTAGRADEWAAVIASHHEAAEDRPAAATWYQRAGKQARTTYAYNLAHIYYRKALEFLPSTAEHQQRAEICEGLANALYNQAHYAEALAYSAQACTAADRTDDVALRVRIWCECSNIQTQAAQLDEARASAKHAESIARASGSPAALTQALSTYAWVLHRQGDADAALALAQEALEIAFASTLQRDAVIAWNVIGAAHWSKGEYRQAAEAFEQSWELGRQLADRTSVAIALNNLGATAYMRGDYAAALAYFDEARQIYRDVGAQRGVWLCRSNVGGSLASLGEYAEAVRCLQALLDEAGDQLYEAPNTYRFLAEAYLGLDDLDEALTAARRSLELAQRMNAQELMGRAWRTLGKIAAAKGAAIEIADQTHTAEDCFATGMGIFTARGGEGERARTLYAWGQYALVCGDRERGESLVQEAQAVFARLGIERP